MKKMFNKAVLNGTTVMGDGLTYPRIPNVYTGDNEGGYQRGDMMDANAVVEMIKELTDTGKITIDELKNLINEEIQERVEGDQDQQRYTDQKIKDLIGTSPETLDTLKEIANALGEDPDFAANVWNKIAELTTKHNEDVQELQDAITSGFENIDFTPYVKKTDVVTDTTNGLMLASDKVKLDALKEKALQLPRYISGDNSRYLFNVFQDRDRLYLRYTTTDLVKNNFGYYDTEIPLAETYASGIMSKSDKAKLNNIEKGAQVNKIESISVNGTPVDPVDKNINLPEVSRTSAGILPAASNSLNGTTIPYFFNYSSPGGNSYSSIRWGKVSFIVPDKPSYNNYCDFKLIIGDNDNDYHTAPYFTLLGASYEGISVDKENDHTIRIKTKISSDSRNILCTLDDGLFVDKTLSNKQDALTEAQLNNINNAITSISVNNIGQVNTNGAVNLTIPNATTSKEGLMSKADKTKLDSLENYTLPAATNTTLGGVKISTDPNSAGGKASNIIHIKEDGAIKAAVAIYYNPISDRIVLYDREDDTHDLGYIECAMFVKYGTKASITSDGVMTKEDKAKLDSQPTIKASDATGVTDDDYVVIKKSELDSILSRLSALENKA